MEEALCRALELQTGLTNLCLAGYPRCHSTTAGVLKALESNTSIRTVSPSLNDDIRGAGVTLLADALEKNTTVTTVNLSHTRLLGDGRLESDLAWRRLAEVLENNTALTDVNIAGIDPQVSIASAARLAEMLETNATLKCLSLAYNRGFDASAMTSLADALEKNSTLTHLNLCGCLILRSDVQLGVNGFERLAMALGANTSLMNVNLSNNDLGADNAVLLAEALENNTVVTNMNLSNTAIRSIGAERLAAAMEKNTTLRNLSITGNSMGDRTTRRRIHRGLVRNASQTMTIIVGLDDVGAIRCNGIGGEEVAFFAPETPLPRVADLRSQLVRVLGCPAKSLHLVSASGVILQDNADAVEELQRECGASARSRNEL